MPKIFYTSVTCDKFHVWWHLTSWHQLDNSFSHVDQSLLFGKNPVSLFGQFLKWKHSTAGSVVPLAMFYLCVGDFVYHILFPCRHFKSTYIKRNVVLDNRGKKVNIAAAGPENCFPGCIISLTRPSTQSFFLSSKSILLWNSELNRTIKDFGIIKDCQIVSYEQSPFFHLVYFQFTSA